MVKVKEIISTANKLAPEQLAYDWDNTGLQLGNEDKNVNNVLITLDLTEDIVDEAVKKGCQLIVSHHPLIFTPLKTICSKTVIGKIINKIIKNDLSIYIMHTNLDLASGGLNDYLAAKFGLKKCSPLMTESSKKLYKLVVFIPLEYFEKVKKEILDSGAGFTGNYSHTSFAVDGTGTFKPLKGSKPFIGKELQLADVKEKRLETVVREDQLNEVLSVVLKHHPYEEVAYDIYPLYNQGESISLGRIGYLEKKVSLEKCLSVVRELFCLKQVKFTGQKNKQIQKIAICSGSGSDLIEKVYQKNIDLFITGDIKYHQAQRAEQLGLALIDAGHFETEIIVTSLLSKYFKDNLKGVNFYETELNTNPWNYY